MPVLVFAPIGVVRVGDHLRAEWVQPLEPDTSLGLIGMLPELSSGQECSFERVQSIVVEHACSAELIMRQGTDGVTVRVGVAIRVVAPSLSEAQQLPGFMPLYYFTSPLRISELFLDKAA